MTGEGAKGVSEGAEVPCVYCDGTVEIDSVEEQPDLRYPDSGVTVTYCEGECDTCHRRVDWDYDPLERPL